MQMQKRKFRIGDLAQKLKVDKFVIRFWEKEFELNSGRSIGGQRFYEEKDFETFSQIKTLLYEQKFTIAGAKKQLQFIDPDSNYNNNIIASQKTIITNSNNTNNIYSQVKRIAFGSQDDQDAINNKNNKTSSLDAKLNPKILRKIVNLRQRLAKLKELLD